MTRYFKSIVGYLFIIKGSFILVLKIIIIIHIYVSVPQKLSIAEYQIFSVKVRDVT